MCDYKSTQQVALTIGSMFYINTEVTKIYSKFDDPNLLNHIQHSLTLGPQDHLGTNATLEIRPLTGQPRLTHKCDTVSELKTTTLSKLGPLWH